VKKLSLNRVFIDLDVKDKSFTKDILSRLNPSNIEYVKDGSVNFDNIQIARGKSILYITNYKGKFCKPCPGTSRDYICCNYYVINETTGCPIDCVYCILQSYMNSRVLTVYANYKQIFKEFDELVQMYPKRILRIGTGELADSLALENITGISAKLIPYFESKKNVLFELKTKTDHVDFLEPFSGKIGNLVISWSLNPQQVIDNIEFKSDSLQNRLKAAMNAQEMGFKLAFHFDPIVHHENWETNYSDLIDLLFSNIDPSNIVWISLGGLRFPPSLKAIIRERFPSTSIIRDEQITGHDQKLRYFKPLRQQMFSNIYSKIRSYSKEVFVYFCMENKDTWEKTMGFTPHSTNHLDFLFADGLYKRFPDMNFTKPDLNYYLQFESVHDHNYQINL